jgi:hypothetical protein
MLLRCCVLLIMPNYEGMSRYPSALNILQGVDRKVNPFFFRKNWVSNAGGMDKEFPEES